MSGAGRVSDVELEAMVAAGTVRKPRFVSDEWCDLIRNRRDHEAAVLAEHRRSCLECRLPLPWVLTDKPPALFDVPLVSDLGENPT